MPIRTWFPTSIYCEPLRPGAAGRFNEGLAEECHRLRDFDAAGRRWSRAHYPGGYTSYASMNELHRFSSTFSDLEKRIDRHVRTYSRALGFDLRGRQVRMTDFWVNINPAGSGHPLHLHPLAFISGTYYVLTPPGCPGIKFEDPRLDRFMAAPPRLAPKGGASPTHAAYPAEAGNLILFESWLRHEVPANQSQGERISVSFNYAWS